MWTVENIDHHVQGRNSLPWKMQRSSHCWDSLASLSHKFPTAGSPEEEGESLQTARKEQICRAIVSKICAFVWDEPWLSCLVGDAQPSRAVLLAGSCCLLPEANTTSLAWLAFQEEQLWMKFEFLMSGPEWEQPTFLLPCTFPWHWLPFLLQTALETQTHAIQDVSQQFLVHSVTSLSILTLTAVKISSLRWRA